jgi:hypothetical protein
MRQPRRRNHYAYSLSRRPSMDDDDLRRGFPAIALSTKVLPCCGRCAAALAFDVLAERTGALSAAARADAGVLARAIGCHMAGQTVSRPVGNPSMPQPSNACTGSRPGR